TVTPTATATVCSDWNVVQSPNVGAIWNQLNAVAAVSSSDVWAVGYYINTGILYQTLIGHWDGAAWSAVPSPNLGTDNNALSGVAAVSSIDVWAVGSYFVSGVGQTLVEHWNGSAWSVVPSPNVGTNHNYLFAVTATSSSDAWGVGYYYTGSVYRTLTEHWNG